MLPMEQAAFGWKNTFDVTVFMVRFDGVDEERKLSRPLGHRLRFWRITTGTAC